MLDLIRSFFRFTCHGVAQILSDFAVSRVFQTPVGWSLEEMTCILVGALEHGFYDFPYPWRIHGADIYGAAMDPINKTPQSMLALI